ncbi:hypothetical protein GCM10017714_14770 [Curtobacterium pusillum]|uniref:Uncharacterized protein n=1 Tax=Curtobacterium pusillum TaxID=69373 RepID=A0AAW3T9V7_9MICO|nr:hypothetical protein [Curtobacterium pusillum]MBA8991485.1 hypothetical protein [Curtobacterium pusillum]NUU13679.1 hypothetical protein [Curtobacterium pusillum]GLK30737.1 hypothetical protein GCM10017610_10220 [Curtobacterium pusillum]
MDTRGNGRRSARITSALVGAGGLVVAMVTGVGLWFGHEQAGTTENTTSGTSTESTTSGTSTESGTSTDQGVTQGSTGGTGTSDATTTGS